MVRINIASLVTSSMNVFAIQAMKIQCLMRLLAVPISMSVVIAVIHVSRIVFAKTPMVHLNVNVNLDTKVTPKLRLVEVI